MSNPNEEANWKAMYLTLVRGITDALERIPGGLPIAERLAEALREAEEIYINGGE